MKLEELEKKLEEVRKYIKNHSLDEASVLMDEILSDSEDAENITVVLEMGQLLRAKENFKEAKIWFEKVLDIDKDNIYAIKAMLHVSCGVKNYEVLAFYVKKIIYLKDKMQEEDILTYLIDFLFVKLFEYKELDELFNVRKIVRILDSFQEYIKDLKLKNIIVNELEILNEQTVLKSKPRVAIISITSRCNIKCKMCKIPYEHWDFPRDKIHEIYDLFPTLQKIIWHGGEPFLYPGIDDLIEEAGKYNVNQVVSTNGLLLNKDRIKKIIDAKMELNISIHGFTKDVYETIHCGGNFKLLLNNLCNIKDIIRQSKLNIKYGLKFLVMKSNYKQLNNLYDFAVEYGFNHVYVNTLGYDTQNEENFIFQNEDMPIMKNVMENSKILSNKFKDTDIMYAAWLNEMNDENMLSSENTLNDEKQMAKKVQKSCCYMPWQSIQVDIYGFVRNNCYCENLILGNINEEKISEIWNNDKIIKIRENIINNGFDEKCSIDCKNGRISNVYLKNM